MADRKIPSITREGPPAPLRSLLCASIAAPARAGRPGAVGAHCRPCVRRWPRHRRRRSPACRSAAALCRSPLDAAGGWVAGHVSVAGDRRACRCWSTRHCRRSPPAVRSVLASCSHRRSPACRKAAARCRSPLDAARWMAGGHVTVAGDRCTCRCWSTRCCGRSLPRRARRWQGAGKVLVLGKFSYAASNGACFTALCWENNVAYVADLKDKSNYLVNSRSSVRFG